MELQEIEAVDFICAARRFADRNKPEDPDYPGHPRIKEWCSAYEKKLSPFLLNDLTLLAEKMVLPSFYLTFLIFRYPGLETGQEILDKLQSLPNDDFIREMKSMYNLKTSELPPPEELAEQLQDDGLNPGYDAQMEAELLIGFLKDPEGFQQRLYRTYLEFYEKAYLPGRKDLADLAEEKLKWHRERLAKGPREYLLSLGMEDFVREMLDKGDPILYFSLFYDNEVMASWNKRTIIIGGTTDIRVMHQSARDKASIFLNCVGDPKRLEILRLTATRPWFSTELARHFDLKPATLSYHLNKLVDANLINITKGEQRRFYYRLNTDAVMQYLEYVGQDLLGLEESRS